MAGVLLPVWAAAVMAGSSIVVLLNSLRLERLPEPVRSPIPDQFSAAAAEIVPALSALPFWSMAKPSKRVDPPVYGR
jgi:hypothetical protein